MKKILSLVFTLAIPVAIFLFLKFFGDNRFQIPVLFEDGIQGCESVESVHRVPEIHLIDQEGQRNATGEDNNYRIYCVLTGRNETSGEMIIQLVRIQDAFYESGEPNFILISSDSNMAREASYSLLEAGMKTERLIAGYLPPDEFMPFLKCGLGLGEILIEQACKLVLVDKERRIRGIYNGLEMEQTEQLILELKILKEQA